MMKTSNWELKMTNSHADISSLNRVISLFPKIKGRRQTEWGGIKTFYGEQIWYANISPEIDDPDVIEDAKRIVDICYPQKKSTFFGGHYYCFCTREYLLNLILFHFADHGVFPEGHVCIVDQWLWRTDAYRLATGWVKGKFWRWHKRSESFQPGEWVKIPPLTELK
jgi:hypothetical protein